MKRNYRILTVVVAAAITFASLMIIAGPQRFTKNMHRHHCEDKEAQGDKTR